MLWLSKRGRQTDRESPMLRFELKMNDSPIDDRERPDEVTKDTYDWQMAVTSLKMTMGVGGEMMIAESKKEKEGKSSDGKVSLFKPCTGSDNPVMEHVKTEQADTLCNKRMSRVIPDTEEELAT